MRKLVVLYLGFGILYKFIEWVGYLHVGNYRNFSGRKQSFGGLHTEAHGWYEYQVLELCTEGYTTYDSSTVTSKQKNQWSKSRGIDCTPYI